MEVIRVYLSFFTALLLNLKKKGFNIIKEKPRNKKEKPLGQKRCRQVTGEHIYYQMLLVRYDWFTFGYVNLQIYESLVKPLRHWYINLFLC